MNSASWHNEVDVITDKFITSFGSLTKLQLNWKRDNSTWSIAQNIAHLIQLNSSYFQNFEEIKKGKHELLQSDSLPSIAISSLQTLQPYTNPDRITRANTWNIWQPTYEEYDVEIMDDFIDHQLEFKKHIQELMPFLSVNTFIKYPGEADLIFKLKDCVDFLISHEKRHWVQTEEVRLEFEKQNFG